MSIDADRQEKYRQIMERVVVPESVRRANSPEEIEKRLRKPLAPGQVWTVVGDDEFCHVVIRSVHEDPRIVTVVPMSLDLEAETPDSLVLMTGGIEELPSIAWPDLARDIPTRVLCKPLGMLDKQRFTLIVNNRPGEKFSVYRGRELDEFGFLPETKRERIDDFLYDCSLQCGFLSPLPSISDRREGQKIQVRICRFLMGQCGMSRSDAEAASERPSQLNKEILGRLLAGGFDADDLKKAELLPESLLCEIELPIVRETVEAYARENPQNADPYVSLAKEAYGLAARHAKNHFGDWPAEIRKVRIRHHA